MFGKRRFEPRFSIDPEGWEREEKNAPLDLDYDLLADKIAIRLFAMLVNAGKESA